MQGASLQLMRLNRNVGSREADLGRVILSKSVVRWSFGERRTKKGFLAMVWSWIFIDTSVNFDVYHRLIRRRLFFVHKWRMCEDDDYGHAKRNDKDVPQNSRRRRTRKASHSVVCQQWNNNKRRPYGCFVYDFYLQMIELSINQKTNKKWHTR